MMGGFLGQFLGQAADEHIWETQYELILIADPDPEPSRIPGICTAADAVVLCVNQCKKSVRYDPSSRIPPTLTECSERPQIGI